MTKLESYMVGGHFTATQFLAEVDGHPADPGVARALEELAFFTTDVKVLGVYPRGPGAVASERDDTIPGVSQDPRTEDLGFARVDLDRAARTGDAEVVYGAGKTPEQVVAILRTLHEQHPDRAVLATRLSRRGDARGRGELGADGRPGRAGGHPRPAARAARGTVAVVSAGHLRRPGRRRGRPDRPGPRRRGRRGHATSGSPGCTGCSASATGSSRPTAWSSSPAWRARCRPWSAA